MLSMREVVAANAARQREAGGLNNRAGEKLFPVLSPDELLIWVKDRIGGAGRMADITNPETLLFPALDQAVVRKVREDNPDTVHIFGQEVRVEYRGIGYQPSAQIAFRENHADDWREILDGGIHLPGGRELKLRAAVEGYSYYIEAPSSQIASKIADVLNAQQWQKFESSATKPAISIPAPEDLSAQIPDVCKFQYGICALTDSALTAFGAVMYVPVGYRSEERFEGKWFRTREEAEDARSKAVTAFAAKQTEAAEKAKKERGNIREVSIDSRGQYHTPVLNGSRIDNMGFYGLTPDYFWSDLLSLVERFGCGTQAFAIYQGDNPLLIYKSREAAESALVQVQVLIDAFVQGGSVLKDTPALWQALNAYRTKEEGDVRSSVVTSFESGVTVPELELETVASADQGVIHSGVKLVQDRGRRGRDESSSGGFGSLADAFARAGL